MIKYGDRFFMYDECPICEGLWRLRNVGDIVEEPVFSYCGCDKVQYAFWLAGYCEDAFRDADDPLTRGRRKTGRRYRREMSRKKRDERLNAMKYSCRPGIGWTEWGEKDGVWQPIGEYVRLPRGSEKEKFFKRHSNKIVRRSKGNYSGNQYRRLFDYWWTIY